MTPYGGILKVTLAVVIGWAWLSGRLATITADVLAAFGDQASTGDPASSSSQATDTTSGILA